MGRETGSLQLLAPLLLTEGKGADLVIRGNVVLNTLDLSASLSPSLLAYPCRQTCINRGSLFTHTSRESSRLQPVHILIHRAPQARPLLVASKTLEIQGFA
jgi:hypothetical protein